MYVSVKAMPTPIRAFLSALGDRLQQPGKERCTLSGSYIDNRGTTTAQLIWQSPGQVRFQRGNSPSALVYSSSSGVLNASSLGKTDMSVLESFLDDPAEAFLFGFGHKSYRLLGLRFRTDGGTNPNYTGRWYDIYEVSGQAASDAVGTTRFARYIFDSDTKLLVKTEYSTLSGIVTTEFNNWAVNNGEAFPGQIVRIENGSTVFTFNINSITVGSQVNDSTFITN
jgi:hypothetical protein